MVSRRLGLSGLSPLAVIYNDLRHLKEIFHVSYQLLCLILAVQTNPRRGWSKRGDGKVMIVQFTDHHNIKVTCTSFWYESLLLQAVMKVKITVIFTSLGRSLVSKTGLFLFLEYELSFILKNKKNWKDKRKR